MSKSEEDLRGAAAVSVFSADADAASAADVEVACCSVGCFGDEEVVDEDDANLLLLEVDGGVARNRTEEGATMARGRV